MLPLALAVALAALPADSNDSADSTGGDAHGESILGISQEPRLELTLWGGEAWSGSTNTPRSETLAGEATWRFDQLDLGAVAGRYRLRETAADGSLSTFSAPVYVARIGQRFETRNGLIARFVLGVGAARTSAWRSWFQVALGARVPFGPVFLAGELSFESEQLMRVGLGLGVSLL